jgi:hypothetical protein
MVDSGLSDDDDMTHGLYSFKKDCSC